MKGNKRILSVVMAILMLFTTFFTQVGIARAFEVPTGSNTMNQLLQKLRSTKPASVNIKDVDARRALAQKHGKELDDNEGILKNPQSQVNPEDSVRIIIKASGQASLGNVKASVSKYGNVKHTFADSFSMNAKYKDIDAIRKMPGVSSVNVANVYYPEMNSATNITKVQEVWKSLGLKGEGMVVAIVDTGIDYRHKDMKLTDPSKAKLDANDVEAGSLGKYFTAKVPYGYNFADDNQDVIDRTDSMHGMHVAGIVAANGNDADIAKDPTSAVKGVAPEAQLLAMKVFSNDPNNSGAFNDDIAAAIDDSVAHGADVINMSLGSTAGYVDENDPEQAAIRRATEAGVVVVVSGGNSGYSSQDAGYAYNMDQDMGVVGSPGLFPDTLQVASSENTTVAATVLEYSGPESGTATYSISEIDPVGVLKSQYELVFCGLGRPEDFTGKRLAGKIALIERGAIDFVTKKLNAQAAGAAGVIVYNHATGGEELINMATDKKVIIPGIFVGNRAGMKLKSLISEGIKVSFTGKKIVIDNPLSLLASDFSSWGTTPGLEFKPEVMAPGGNIYSTVNNNKYEVMGGTSMASPHTAGVTALVIQNLKKTGATQTGRELVELAKKIIINTAEPVMDPKAELPYLTRKQGAGLINAENAIKTSALVTVDGKATVALKEIGNSTEFIITVSNFGDKNLNFKVKDTYGVLTNFSNSADKTDYLYPYANLLEGAKVSFDKTEIEVPSKGQVQVKVTLTIPEEAVKNIFAEGFITLESTTEGQPSLGVPYMGFYGKWDGQDGPRVFDAPMWEDESYFGETTLLGTAVVEDETGYYYIGQTGNYSNGMPIINSKYISFSPNADDLFDSVLPNVSFMRNAKEFKVQVVNGNGNVVRDISIDTNIRKNFTDGQTSFSKLSSDWAWDGRILDPATNRLKVAPEGEYKIRLTGTPDFENAEPYVLEMPVKLDITAPELRITSNPEITGLNQYKLTWSGHDNVGIQEYRVYDFAGISSEEQLGSNDIVVPEAVVLSPQTEELEMNLSNGEHAIIVVATDYAGNEWGTITFIDNNLITINGEKNILTRNTDVTIDYSLDNRIKFMTNHVDIVVDDNAAINNEMRTSIKLEGLSHGDHVIAVKAIDKDGIVIAQDIVNITVDILTPVIETDLSSGDYITERFVHIEGSVNEPVKYVRTFNIVDGDKIIITDITPQLIEEDGSFAFDYSFDSDGVQNINIEAEDLAGNVTTFAYKVFVDFTKPVIRLMDPVPNERDQVYVNSDEYTLKFTVSDNVLGYRLYINGNQIDYVEDAAWDGTEPKEYSYTVSNIPLGISRTTIKAVDMLGNEVSRVVTFYRTETPVIFVNSVLDEDITPVVDGQLVFGSKLDLSLRVDYHEEITSVMVNGEYAELDENDRYIISLNFEGYGEQTIDVQVEGINEAGETVTASKAVKVNVVPVELESNNYLINNNTPLELFFRTDAEYTVTASIGELEVDIKYVSIDAGIYAGSINLRSLPDGTHKVELQFSNGEGEVVWTEEITVIIDSTEPIAAVSNPENNKFNRTTIGLSGTVNETVKSVKVNGYVAELDGNNWSVDVAGLTQGNNTLTIKTEDFAGNISFVSHVVYVDSVKPAITITSPANKAEIKNDKVTVTGKVVDASTLTVKVNEVTVSVAADGSFQQEVTFTAYGDQDIIVTAVDALGNKATDKKVTVKLIPYLSSISVTIDKTELERGQAAVFTAEATYSDGSKADVTNTAEWTTEKGTIVKGAFTAPADFSGDVKVTAKLENVEGTATIKVKVPTVVKIDITSTSAELLVGKTAEMNAVATYSDGTTKDVTTEVTFAVTNAVAKVEGKVLTALAAGDARITAELQGVKSNEVALKVTKPAEPARNYIQITASRLNVRTGPSTRYRVIGTLTKGQVVEYTALTGGWYKITFNGQTAYVSASYAKVVQQSVTPAPTPAAGQKQVTVTASALNVRKGPGTSYGRIGCLYKGAVVTVLGTSGNWYKISYNGQTAYISKSYTK